VRRVGVPAGLGSPEMARLGRRHGGEIRFSDVVGVLRIELHIPASRSFEGEASHPAPDTRHCTKSLSGGGSPRSATKSCISGATSSGSRASAAHGSPEVSMRGAASLGRRPPPRCVSRAVTGFDDED